MGGQISIESQRENGTTIRCTFPVKLSWKFSNQPVSVAVSLVYHIIAWDTNINYVDHIQSIFHSEGVACHAQTSRDAPKVLSHISKSTTLYVFTGIEMFDLVFKIVVELFVGNFVLVAYGWEISDEFSNAKHPRGQFVFLPKPFWARNAFQSLGQNFPRHFNSPPPKRNSDLDNFLSKQPKIPKFENSNDENLNYVHFNLPTLQTTTSSSSTLRIQDLLNSEPPPVNEGKCEEL
jgi:hypothetical protein